MKRRRHVGHLSGAMIRDLLSAGSNNVREAHIYFTEETSIYQAVGKSSSRRLRPLLCRFRANKPILPTAEKQQHTLYICHIRSQFLPSH
jgi:hypothetical protein